ncbi:PTS sugar transporter subunit IIA [Lacticaseibacillus manihotivorans]|uniref:PTS sugar transporter subunit IIA n=1 Tax=Lacticaseibacillus manihotivorans TaxID=88233 RepID=UPI001FB38BF1|nr:glucose PTS transporter subunit IIA [Lacticaseibacillus manihotivorans]
MAVVPSEGKVTAPFDGTVVSVFPTKHALGLRSNSGIELLIHIGLDTVNLKGQHFDSLVKGGDIITLGQTLEKFDIQAIENEGYDVTVPIVVTNSNEYSDVILDDNQRSVTAGDELFSVVPQTKSEKHSAAVQA